MIAAVYASMLIPLRDLARECGYALALHGSMGRDLDLIAVPWVEDAIAPADLVERIRIHVGGDYLRAPEALRDSPLWQVAHHGYGGHGAAGPHGRVKWSIYFGRGPDVATDATDEHRKRHPYYIDISVMPRAPKVGAGC